MTLKLVVDNTELKKEKVRYQSTERKSRLSAHLVMELRRLLHESLIYDNPPNIEQEKTWNK